MSKWTDENPWVWVLVQEPGPNERFLGRHDEETGISFIPFFQEKEGAVSGLEGLVRDKQLEYEAQAIRYRELAEDAFRNGFHLFYLDGAGRVLEKIAPTPTR
jgi:hypothetical protein